MDSLNFNSVENLPGLDARASFQVSSLAVFKEDVDIVPTIIDALVCAVGRRQPYAVQFEHNLSTPQFFT